MKKILVFLLPVLLASACSLFQRPSMSQKEIDVLVTENQALRDQLSTSADLEDQLALTRMQLDEAMLQLSACEETAQSGIHIVIGAFKITANAEAYSARVKESGMDGRILSGPYRFHLVTAQSCESVQEAFTDLLRIRENAVEKAWIYIE